MSVDIATLGIKVDASQVNKAERDLDKLGNTGERVTTALGKLGAAVAALGIAAAAAQAIKLADTYSNMQGRLGLVTRGTDELAVVTERLYDVAQRTRQGLEATTDLYANLGRTTKALGASQNELLQITETVSQALIVSGASAASSEAALRQLGQGFASGALRGDELNSIMENTPRLAQAIAEGMGVTIGQLREMGKEGKLTGEAIFDALLSQQAIIEAEFSRMPVTVGQAITQLNNAILSFVGEANNSLGVTRALADGIKFVADNVDKAVPIFAALATVISVALAPAIGRAAIGIAAVTASTVAGTIATIAAIPAQLAFAAAFNGTSVATAALTTSMAALKAASVALLGLGIIGAVVAIAGAFLYLNNAVLSTKEATALITDSNRSYIETLQTAADYQRKYGLNVEGTNSALDASLGITAQSNNMADAAAAASLRAAAAERQWTIDILKRRAALMMETGDRLMRSGDTEGGIAAVAGNQLLNPGNIFGFDFEGNDRRRSAAYGAANLQYQGAATIERTVQDIANAPLTPAPARTGGGGGGGERSGRRSAISEEQRELERATETAKDYAASLAVETAELSQNNVQRRMATTEAAAAAAPTEALAASIRAAGDAWKAANDNAATNEFLKQLRETNEETAFETSLQGMNAREREVANAQRAITIALAQAEEAGVSINREAIAAETAAILANAAARGQRILDVDNANAYADAMARVADSVGSAADGLRGLFGEAGDALAEITARYVDYGSTVADIQARIAEAEQAHGRDSVQAMDERARSSSELAQLQIEHYGSMLSAAKGFFEEGSAGYKVMQAAEQAYRLYQFAMAVRSMFMETTQTAVKGANVAARVGLEAVETTASVAGSGARTAAFSIEAIAKVFASIPFPFNIAAAAIVGAAMIGFGIKVFGGGGSKGGATGSAARAVEPTPTTYTPFVSHDRASGLSGANDNRISPPVQGPLDRFVNGQRSGNVFDFSNANFSGSDPEAVKAAVRQGIEQARPELLDDARRQSAEDLQQLSRQRMGG